MLAEVQRGPELPRVERPPGWVGPIDPDPWQLLRIRVREVLFGAQEPEELIVHKPENPYILAPGDLLDSDRVMLLEARRFERHPQILGLYGPTMYRREDVLRQLDVSAPAVNEFIGVASMEADGTIVLWLRAESPEGSVGDAVLRYPPSDERYDQVLAHLGGLRPGEEKPVRPFPE